MQKIWTEEDITFENLAAHIEDSGLQCKREPTRIVLHTASGIGYLVVLDEDKKFIRFLTYLPVAKDAFEEQKREFEHRLNAEVFMASFWLDDDNDLVVDYSMTYVHGLIAGQFMVILHRFASMLEYVMGSKNEDGLIILGQKSKQEEQVDDGEPTDSGRPSTDAARLLN
ncbi:YbjN domain-containing protein [Paraburkholderia sacchari]|uniref:YbjN domain-containing protein n=1 Tax=Paraburkholderia sacchari TaxID=159450 RepID=UPI001FD10948|nr:YbjN domain-containing protein [Paraburkholderia sacchari]